MDSKRHHRQKRRRLTMYLGFGGCLLLVFIIAGWQIAELVRSRILASERQRMLETMTLLPDVTGSKNCILQPKFAKEGAYLLIISPNRSQWKSIKHEQGSYRLHQVKGLRTVKDKSLKLTSPGAEKQRIRIFRTYSLFHVAASKEKAFRVEIPEKWRVYIRTQSNTAPEASWKITKLVNSTKKDNFMREKFGTSSEWTIESGNFRTVTRGGGKKNVANPFILRGGPAKESENAVAKTGWDVSGNYSVRVSTRDISQNADYALEAGGSKATKLSLRWNSVTAEWRFLLHKNGNTRILKRYSKTLPGKNWARLRITLHSPFSASAAVDRINLGRFRFNIPVYGPIRLKVFKGKAQFDDMHISPAEEAESKPWTRLHMQSKRFAKKPLNLDKDMDFAKWAKDTAGISPEKITYRNESYPALRYSAPVYGPFSYEGAPPESSRLLFRIQGRKGSSQNLFFRHVPDKGWQYVENQTDISSPSKKEKENAASEPPPEDLSELRYRFRDKRLFVNGNRTPSTLSPDMKHPFHLTLSKLNGEISTKNHILRSPNLWNEFFADSPAAWCAWTGKFGMLTRWHCEPYWNWMGIYSLHSATLFSRHAYEGDQTIDFYAAFKDTVKQAEGVDRRYVRANMNFSFCTNGVAPSSGYSLLFGGFGNSGTYLIKNGQILAENKKKHIPEWPGHEHDIHWRWWHFKIRKHNRRITVHIDNEKVLETEVKKPLNGGHLAFWTVRNGILLSRVRIAAEDREWQPAPFRISPQAETASWKPLAGSRVEIQKDDNTDRATVTNRTSGGVFGAKWTGKYTNLENTPILRLPLKTEPNTKVNLHLQISGERYLLPVSAPVKNTATILSRKSRAGPDKNHFLKFAQKKFVPEERILDPVQPDDNDDTLEVNLLKMLRETDIYERGQNRVESIVVGNTSNDDYLLAGFYGNGKGTTYTLGNVSWEKAEN